MNCLEKEGHKTLNTTFARNIKDFQEIQQNLQRNRFLSKLLLKYDINIKDL